MAHPPRKTPRQARARATAEALVEAAARIMETEGRAALTTNRIAERAGASVGSLYQYFPNREAIVAALARGLIDAAARAGETDPAPLRPRLEAAVLGYLTWPRPPSAAADQTAGYGEGPKSGDA